MMSSSSTAAFPLVDHRAPSPTEQLCYVHCNCCDTILAVSDHPRAAERAGPTRTHRHSASSSSYLFLVCFFLDPPAF
jgi:hypothetical protein